MKDINKILLNFEMRKRELTEKEKLFLSDFIKLLDQHEVTLDSQDNYASDEIFVGTDWEFTSEYNREIKGYEIELDIKDIKRMVG